MFCGGCFNNVIFTATCLIATILVGVASGLAFDLEYIL